ncbi:MAG: hypothetical protein E7653_04000 [Ruminococcaceae bacterium]|nr:hypothetical protein [Oscillospiraceae bacterium]
MKKNIIRALSLVLVLIMMLGMFVSCKKNKEEEGTTNNPTDANSLRYNGEEINILGRKETSGIREYFDKYEDVAGHTVNEAIYNRNVYTTDQLNIVTTHKETDDSKAVSDATISHQSGGTYDVYCVYSLYASTLAVQGLYTNLKQYQFFDTTQPWYPSKLVKDATIFDKLYFVSGDVSMSNIFMSSLIYYNKDIYTNKQVGTKLKNTYGYDSIYDLAREGKWTVDVMFTLSKGIYADTDKDNTKSAGDTFGFGTYETLYDNFYYGAGLTTIKSTSKGLEMSDGFKNTDKISNILTTVNTFLKTNDGYTSGNTHEPVRTAFSQQRLLFYLAPATHAYTTFRTVPGLTYGVLPVPMYEANQDGGYQACLSNPYSMYGVASASNTPEIGAAYLHILGKNSYEITRPVFFDETMKLKYAENVDDSDMWDMVINSQSYDLGKVFCEQIGDKSPTVNNFRECIRLTTNDWNGKLTANRKAINNSLTTLNEQFKTLQ